MDIVSKTQTCLLNMDRVKLRCGVVAALRGQASMLLTGSPGRSEAVFISACRDGRLNDLNKRGRNRRGTIASRWNDPGETERFNICMM